MKTFKVTIILNDNDPLETDEENIKAIKSIFIEEAGNYDYDLKQIDVELL